MSEQMIWFIIFLKNWKSHIASLILNITCLLKVEVVDSLYYILLWSEIKTNDFSIYIFDSEHFRLCDRSSSYSAVERKIYQMTIFLYFIDFSLSFDCLPETSKNSFMNLKHQGYMLTYLGQYCCDSVWIIPLLLNKKVIYWSNI